MPRPNRQRMEISPLVVRLSVLERAALDGKARIAGMIMADAARAAFDEWTPRRADNVIRKTDAGQNGGEITVEYDE